MVVTWEYSQDRESIMISWNSISERLSVDDPRYTLMIPATRDDMKEQTSKASTNQEKIRDCVKQQRALLAYAAGVRTNAQPTLTRSSKSKADSSRWLIAIIPFHSATSLQVYQGEKGDAALYLSFLKQ